jgi:hypothetical protein
LGLLVSLANDYFASHGTVTSKAESTREEEEEEEEEEEREAFASLNFLLPKLMLSDTSWHTRL